MDINPEIRGFIDADGKIKSWPGKQSKQFILIDLLGEAFETGREYSQLEVNEILNSRHTFNDPALLRRELINRKILERSADGRVWRKVEIATS